MNWHNHWCYVAIRPAIDNMVTLWRRFSSIFLRLGFQTRWRTHLSEVRKNGSSPKLKHDDNKNLVGCLYLVSLPFKWQSGKYSWKIRTFKFLWQYLRWKTIWTIMNYTKSKNWCDFHDEKKRQNSARKYVRTNTLPDSIVGPCLFSSNEGKWLGLGKISSAHPQRGDEVRVVGGVGGGRGLGGWKVVMRRYSR